MKCDPNDWVGGDCGLTKREWLAGMAMMGLRASRVNQYNKPERIWTSEYMATQAVLDANALIAELNKEAK